MGGSGIKGYRDLRIQGHSLDAIAGGAKVREQLEVERIRGAEAKQLLDNKYLKEAWDAAERSILDQMDEVNLRDTDMHTKLIMARKVLTSVKKYLERMVQTGEMATLQLKEPHKLTKLLGR
jgi:hypothetical protein